MKFDRIERRQGLSQSSVNCIHQDRQGFVWFGTANGLDRYDGYQIKSFRPDLDDPSALTDGDVTALHEDSQGQLWIGTGEGGLNVLDLGTYRIHHPLHEQGQDLLHGSIINQITEDEQGKLWVASGQGLFFLEGARTEVHRFGLFENESNTHQIFSLCFQKDGTLLVGTREGLFAIDTHDLSVTHRVEDITVMSLFQKPGGHLWLGSDHGLYYLDFNDQLQAIEHEAFDSPGSLKMRALYAGRNRVLWLGTEDGLGKLETTADSNFKITFTRHNPSDPNSLSLNHISSIFEDPDGVLFVGTWGAGVNRFDRDRELFKLYQHDSRNPRSLAQNMVNAVYEDRQQRLWVGTDEGLDRRDESEGNQFSHLALSQNANTGNPGIYSIAEDDSGTIWLASFRGVIRLDPESETHQYFAEQEGLSDNSVWCLAYGKKNIWAGTRNGGLNQIATDGTHPIRVHNHQPGNPKSLSYSGVSHVMIDQQERLWAGTLGGGLNLMHDDGSFTHYVHQDGEPRSLSDDRIIYLHQTPHDGLLWLATMGGGLNRFDPETGLFDSWRRRDGLPADTVYSVLHDNKGFLWVATDDGLARFDPTTETFKIYVVQDGLQDNEFNAAACHRTARGTLYFAGIGGLTEFAPERLLADSAPPSVFITRFLLFNREVRPGQSATPLKMPVEHAQRIELGDQQNVFAFEFAALSYADPNRNHYAYMLEPFNQEWVFSSANNRLATYTNLQAGKYILKYKGANKQGSWSEVKTLRLKIHPPVWRSWWAYVGYILAMLGMVLGYLRSQNKKLAFERQMVVRLREIDRLKDDFLANTSHELRTPLNGIIGLAESMLDGVAGPVNLNQAAQLTMVASSGRRLAALVDDILDFSKLRNQGLKLQLGPVDVGAVTDVVFTLCAPLAADKGLSLNNEVPDDLPTVYADENRLEQILYNLVGNAIKFTEHGGIVVKAEVLGEMVAVSIHDSGIGIPEHKQEGIFHSFEQLEDSTRRAHGGTGLGLALSRRLVLLHGGEISVNSVVEQGSVFTFTLPLAQEPVTNLKNRDNLVVLRNHNPKSGTLTIDTPGSTVSSRFHILVADDEPVNRQVLLNHLSKLRQRITAVRDGHEALKVMQEHTVDLVLLDVMMPGMSGFEVCRKIRETHPVDELPVIFLSARTRDEDLVAGFSAGGNDYLTKPVSKQELLERVKVHLRLVDARQVMVRTHQELREKNQELITAHQKLVIQEKMATVGTLASGIVHELKNPANYTNICAQSLSDELEEFQHFLFELAGDDDPEVHKALSGRLDPLFELLSTVLGGTERLKEIALNLGGFSRMGKGDIRFASISDCLNSTLALVKARYKNIVNFHLDYQDPLETMCRPAALSQVFMNLLVNGCQAIVANEEKKAQRGKGDIWVAVRREDELGIVEIKDNGGGIDPKLVDQIFEPFFTTKPEGEGTGLGLSISKQIVEEHEGTLTMTTEAGEYTAFKMTILLKPRDDEDEDYYFD